MSARTLGYEGGWIVRSHNPTSVGEENETPFITVWKPLSSRRVLKPRGESPKKTISANETPD